MVEITGDVMDCVNTVTGKNYASTYCPKSACVFVSNRGKMNLAKSNDLA